MSKAPDRRFYQWRECPNKQPKTFSKRQIELFRQFYRTFPIANALRSQLGWTHYKIFRRSRVVGTGPCAAISQGRRRVL